MTDNVLAIDHIMVHVADSQQAGRIFETLGFTATPKSGMPGLSNRLVCFGQTPADLGVCNYIELMALEDAAIAPPPMPHLLQKFGPVSSVVSADDARAVTARLSEEGLEIGPVLDLQRDWQLSNGEIITPAFAVAIPQLGQAPIYWNYCQHKTAQHYVRPEFTEHANGALCISEVTAVVDSPDDAAAHYARHWKADRHGDRLTLPYGPALQLMSTQDMANLLPDGMVDVKDPGIKLIRVMVRDLAQAQSVVAAGGIDVTPVVGGFAVRAADAAGCAILFAV